MKYQIDGKDTGTDISISATKHDKLKLLEALSPQLSSACPAPQQRCRTKSGHKARGSEIYILRTGF